MIPVLFKLTFETTLNQVLGYLALAALVGYIAWAGWRGAVPRAPAAAGSGPKKAKAEEAEPTTQDRLSRALRFGIPAIGLAGWLVRYAYPASAIPGGEGKGIPIHTYGILLASGFLLAVTLAARMAEREWRDDGAAKREQLLDLSFYIFIGALVGSKLLFIIVNWSDYSKSFGEIFTSPARLVEFFSGGLVFQGGLIGAAAIAYWYAKKHRLDFLRIADIMIPTVSLGAALGRLGCFSAGCCWGDIAHSGFKLGVNFPGAARATTLLGGQGGVPSMAFQSQSTDPRYVVEATGEVLQNWAPNAVQISTWAQSHGYSLPVHPTQLYESVGQLLLFAAAISMRRYRRFHGQVFAFWLMAYAILRSSVELFRGDLERGTLHGLLRYLGSDSLAESIPQTAWYNISTSQFGSMAIFALGAAILYRNFHRLTAPVSLATPAPAAT